MYNLIGDGGDFFLVYEQQLLKKRERMSTPTARHA